MITKQDLQQILKLVSRQSVKDTQFPVAKELTGIESMAIVQNGANKITSLTQLVEYVYKNLDLDDIDASYWKKSEEDDSTRELIKDKLRNILTYLYNLASAPYNGNGSKVSADTIEYTNNLIQEAPGTVASALTYVIGLMPDKADLITLGNNKRIPYNQLPQLCLVKMDTPKSAYMNTHSDYYYFNQTTKKINYIPRLGETIIIDPVSNIAYLDLETRNWYTWNPDTQSMDIVKNSAELDNHGTLTPDQWPRTILISATPMTDEEALSKLGDGDLFVKIMDTDEATVAMVMNDAVELVSPSATVVYYALDENAFYYYNGVEFHKITGTGSDVDLTGYVKTSNATNKLEYDVLPSVTLASMTVPTAQTLSSNKEFYYYNNNTRKIVFHSKDGIQTSYNPQEGVIYYNETDDIFVMWKNNSTKPWATVGGSGFVEGKADVLNSTTMLEPSEWPKVVINNIDATSSETDEAGDVIYNASKRRLYYIKEYTSDDQPVLVDMGRPQTGTIYCLKSTNALYRWTGDTTSPWQLISSGGSGGSFNGTIEGTSLVLGKPASPSQPDAPYIGTDGDGGCCIIDLVKYEITEGIMEKGGDGHYTDGSEDKNDNQYELMYKNATGFTRAFRDAYDNGYSKVVVPKGDYCFTPIFNTDGAAYTSQGVAITPGNTPPIIWLLNMDGLEIDLSGSTFHVMVDSTTHSKYYNSGISSWNYLYSLIGIGQCRNITVKNGHFRGDMYTRDYSYNLGSQIDQEGGYGIFIGFSKFTYNISLIGLEGSGFSGDFIKHTSHSLCVYNDYFWHTQHGTGLKHQNEYIGGAMNYGYYFRYGEGTVVQKADNTSSTKYAISGFHDLSKFFSYGTTTEQNNGKYKYANKEASLRDFSLYNNGDNNRMVNCYGPQIEVLTYSELPSDPTTLPLRIIRTGYCESFHLFPKERYVRLQFLYENGLKTGEFRGSSAYNTIEAARAYFLATPTHVYGEQPENGGEDAGQTGPLVTIAPKLNSDVLIEGCIIHDNGRGGIEGGANNTTIRNCTFEKRQSPSTWSSIGALPTFFAGSTNYHISDEDNESNELTVEGCTFYSSIYNLAGIYNKTTLRWNFHNNVCYRVTPHIVNCFHSDITGNTFYDTPLNSIGDWIRSGSVSKRKMMRVLNYTNNVYYNMSKNPEYSYYENTVQSMRDCYIEINVPLSTKFNPGTAFLSGKKDDYVLDGCTIKFITNGTYAYFPYLRNCIIEGGTEWYVSRIENCKLIDSKFKIVHNLCDTVDNVAHIYVKGIRGLDFRSTCLPFYESAFSNLDIPAHDYYVHFNDCDVDISKVNTNLLSYTDSAVQQRYKNIILEYNNCRFTGSASSTALTNSNESHQSYLIFNNCRFDLETPYLFGGAVGANYRYFEFNDCVFNTAEFTLGTQTNSANLICGGNAGTNRPMLTKQGSMYFNTTLNSSVGKPIWRKSGPMTLSEINQNGVEFVDATGTIV